MHGIARDDEDARAPRVIGQITDVRRGRDDQCIKAECFQRFTNAIVALCQRESRRRRHTSPGMRAIRHNGGQPMFERRKRGVSMVHHGELDIRKWGNHWLRLRRRLNDPLRY